MISLESVAPPGLESAEPAEPVEEPVEQELSLIHI